jgi:hypothetical protein
MPFKSDKQERLFEAVAHNPAFAQKVHMDQGMARKYIADSKGGHRPATESVTVQPSTAVNTTGYVQPTNTGTFKIF